MQNAQTFSQKTPKSRKLVHFWVTFQNLGCTSLPKLRISPGLATMTPPPPHTHTLQLLTSYIYVQVGLGKCAVCTG